MNLLIADDHPIFRKGLKGIILESFPDIEIFEAQNGTEAIEIIRSKTPDISILDINMPEINGLDVAQLVLKEKLNTRVIMLTMYKEKEMIRKAMLSGAHGYVLKDFAIDEIIDCIKKVTENEKYIGRNLHSYYSEITYEDKKKQKLMELLNGLSQSELKTLKLVSKNKSTKEISELLFLSEKTIENYRSKICQKLELPARNNSLLLWVSENKELLSSISEF
jgi:DNA-binding NarL/FixJ family response regulator